MPVFVRRLLLTLLVGVAGFVAGALTLVVLVIRSGPRHEVWHDVDLGEEFRAARAASVATLDDYLALEGRLFDELDREVYARVETGPGAAYVRYSAGSLADPRQLDVDWNRTFELRPAGPPVGGALLLHGMSDSPYSVRAVAEALRDAGLHCVGLRLPGHGTAPGALKAVDAADLVAAVRLGVRGARARVGGRPLHLVGYSTGASLAIAHVLDVLDGAVEPMPDSLVLLSPAVGLTPAAAFAGVVQAVAAIPGLENAAWTDILPEFDPYKYGSFPVHAGQLVYELTAANAERIAARAAGGPIVGFPRTLVFASAVDATVSPDAVVDRLLRNLEPGRHELVLFDVNRAEVDVSLLVDDPGPLARQLAVDGELPFAFTLVTNRDVDTTEVVARVETGTGEDLGLAWPRGVMSLSHVAIPFPADDPVYGRVRPATSKLIHLGMPVLQGERGVLRLPADALLRIRHNPFFGYLAARTVDWVGR